MLSDLIVDRQKMYRDARETIAWEGNCLILKKTGHRRRIHHGARMESIWLPSAHIVSGASVVESIDPDAWR